MAFIYLVKVELLLLLLLLCIAIVSDLIKTRELWKKRKQEQKREEILKEELADVIRQYHASYPIFTDADIRRFVDKYFKEYKKE